MSISRKTILARSSARRLFTFASVALGVLGVSSSAEAAGLNDYACKPTAARPYPVVLAHGRSGHASDMGAIIDALTRAGYCVFGEDYGQVNGVGQTGMNHLTVSGGEFKNVVDNVLAVTGARQINAVGYSEGMGVIANFILEKGGASQVHRVASFGGLHHPYAHVGLANVIDGTLFLPNTIRAVRDLVPPFTSNVQAKDVAASALGLASVVGLHLPPDLEEIVESNFASDLFDPTYWISLHGGLSETPATFVAVNTTVHGVKTKDAAPNVCYTNIVSTADPITGVNAGFQDEAPNVDNFLLVSSADHGGIIADPVALAKMMSGFDAPCGSEAPSPAPQAPGSGNGAGPAAGGSSPSGPEAAPGLPATDDAAGGNLPGGAGDGACSASRMKPSAAGSSAGILAAVLGLASCAYRRRRDRRA